MRRKTSILIMCFMLLLSISINAFCGLGGTKWEIEIMEKELRGEISSQEAADLINALPIEQRNSDVQKQASNSNNSIAGNATDEHSANVIISEPKCSHTYTSEVLSEPTCTEKGIRKYTCQSCGNSYTEEIELIDEHDYKEEITKEPTCDETGEKTFTCKDCEKTYTELINSLGHSDGMKQTKNPTCTEPGEMTYTCTRCGLSHVENIEAKGHTEGEWNTVTPHSMFSEGLKEKNCTDCGTVLTTEVIPSTYPIYYLYVGIGAAVIVAICAIAGISTMRKKK